MIDPKEGLKVRQCLHEIYEHGKKDPTIYSTGDTRMLSRVSKLTRLFTAMEARNVYNIHARIPREEKTKEDPKPWMEKGIKSKRSFYDI